MYPVLAALEFEHPWRLVWLAAAPVVAYFAFRSWTSLSSRRRAVGLACRLLVLGLATAACASPVRRFASEQRMVVFAVDLSRSAASSRAAADQFIAAARRTQGEHRTAFIAFAGQPGPLTDRPPSADASSLDGGSLDGGSLGWGERDIQSSDPAAAISLAAASIPADYVPQVVLLSDGNQTQGDLAQAAAGAGVPISTIPLTSFADPEVCVVRLQAPAQMAFGDDVPVEVVLAANVETTGMVELLGDQKIIATADVALRPGENHVHFQVRLDQQAADGVTFTARIQAERDTIAENNQRRARVAFGPRPRVLVVADAEDDAPLVVADALRSVGDEVTVGEPSRIAQDPAALDAFDALVLINVSPEALTAAQFELVERYVRDAGGGLIVVGGQRTFGEAVFRDSALERLLPVAAAATPEAEKPILAMVLVIDRSGSMDEERRLELAKEAAKQSVSVLEAHDKAGVLAFSDDSEWIAPLTTVADKASLLRQIDTLTAYGQTNMYPGVVRAMLALEQTAADRRHMILLTDGIPTPGEYYEIARGLAAAGITLSTVSISAGAEQDMLKLMAATAGGRHHHCNDPTDVPGIMVRETQVVAANETQRAFRPFALRALPGLDVSCAPPRHGFVPTNPKPNAEPLLFATAGHPLLCWGRHGAGVTLALTTPIQARQADAWATWPGYPALWKRLVQHVARPSRPSPVRLTASRQGTTLSVAADLVAADGQFVDGQFVDGQFADGASLTAVVAGPDDPPRSIGLPAIAPGRYAATFPASPQVPSEYRIRVTAASASISATAEQHVFIDYADELLLRPTDEPLLRRVAELTGGAFHPDPASVFASDGRTVERVARLWPHLLLAAALLLVGDVAVRRLPF